VREAADRAFDVPVSVGYGEHRDPEQSNVMLLVPDRGMHDLRVQLGETIHAMVIDDAPSPVNPLPINSSPTKRRGHFQDLGGAS
jgi:hypothetical protein